MKPITSEALTAAECAERTGLTVRALRVYEEVGLIQPQRTSGGWRVYGTRDLVRLNSIALLKSAGLTLAQIKAVTRFSDTDPSLAHVLQMQVEAWKAKQEAALRGQTLVEAALQSLSTHASLSIDELCALVRTLEMSEQGRDTIPSASDTQEIQISTATLDRYVGWYRASRYVCIAITREGSKLFTERAGLPRHELLAQSDTEFFAPATSTYGHFEVDTKGCVTHLVLHKQGVRQSAPRIEASQAAEVQAQLAARTASQTPTLGSEACLRRLVDGIRCGTPNYHEMSSLLAAAIRAQMPLLQATANYLGAIVSIEFRGVGNQGFDVYKVNCEHGSSQWRVDVSANGVIDNAATFAENAFALSASSSARESVSPYDSNTNPRSESALRRMLESIQAGAPNYDEMSPMLAYTIKQQLPQLQTLGQRFGALCELQHISTELQRFDIYEVKREHGSSRIRIAVNDDGIITSAASVVTSSSLTAGP